MTARSMDAAVDQNHYLQASHSLLTWIESSKSSLERLIDNIPSAFIICDSSLEIKRANVSFASLLGINMDDCVGINLQSVHSHEDARALERALGLLRSSKVRSISEVGDTSRLDNPSSLTTTNSQTMNSVTLETMVRSADRGKNHRSILWQISLFRGAHKEARNWYSFYGTDVTELRAFESKLVQIFSSLPVGVLQVDEQLKVTGPYSDRATLLLGENNLQGRSLHELLFAPCWDSLTAQQKAGIGLLHASLGALEIQFELLKDELPRMIRYPARGNLDELWLALTFQPRVEGGLVTGFLVLIEDRTSIEQLNQHLENAKKIESISAARYMEIERLDASILPSVLSDFALFLPRITLPLTGIEQHLELARTLHGLKGTSRFARLSRLKDLCHSTEDIVLSIGSGSTTGEHGTLENAVEEVLKEALALETLGKWMLSQHNQTSIQSTNAKPLKSLIETMLESLPNRLNALAQETAKQGGKNLRLISDLSAAKPMIGQFTQNKLDALQEALIHIVTNSADHGIEVEKDRALFGKVPEGTIKVSLVANLTSLCCTVEDDGAGFQFEHIISRAQKMGLLTPLQLAEAQNSLPLFRENEQAKRILDDLCASLIFAEGFSSRENVTSSSGRGIGMFAAHKAILKEGGTISIAHKLKEGLTFSITIPK